MADKRYGLRLKGVNGEPPTPHTIPPLPGFYSTAYATPVGGDGELSLEDARRALKPAPDGDGLGDVLELVTLKAGEVDEAKDAQAEALAAARGGIAAAARDAREREPSGEERARIEQETTAAAAAEGA